MSKKIVFGEDLIKELEKYGLHKYSEDFEQYKDYVIVSYCFTIPHRLSPTTPRIEFDVDAETDGFIFGTMYTEGSKGYGEEFDSYEDVKYFINNAKWSNSDLTESKKYLK